MIKCSGVRIRVGRRRNNWVVEVWYEPIFEEVPEGLTAEGLAPEIGLYSKSRGDSTHEDPMLGQVAWEPLFDLNSFESSNAKEKKEMQKKFLYNAWRYLTANDADDIIIIEDQLTSGDPRHRALAQECKAARKQRSRNAQYRRCKRVERGLPARSIEVDSESESGYESEEMPPPPRPGSHRPNGGFERTPSALFMSGGRENSIDAQREGSRIARSNEDMAAPTGQIFHATGSIRNKRMRAPNLGIQRNVRQRADGSQFGLSGTRSNSLGEPGRDQGEGRRAVSGAAGSVDANGGLDEQAALDEAIRRSQAPGEDERIWDENGSLHPEDAESVATRNSMAPESDIEM
jgi:hypothetical protein